MKSLLEATDGGLEGQDLFFAFELMMHHPRAEEKMTPGLEGIGCGKHSKHPCKSYYADRVDGSKEFWSHMACIDGVFGLTEGDRKRQRDDGGQSGKRQRKEIDYNDYPRGTIVKVSGIGEMDWRELADHLKDDGYNPRWCTVTDGVAIVRFADDEQEEAALWRETKDKDREREEKRSKGGKGKGKGKGKKGKGKKGRW